MDVLIFRYFIIVSRYTTQAVTTETFSLYFVCSLNLKMFQNLENCLEKYIPQEELNHVQRILYGKKLE